MEDPATVGAVPGTWPVVLGGDTLSNASLAHMVGGLTATSAYSFVVTATNAIATSPTSTVAVLSTGELSAPSPPRDLALSAATGGALTLEWEAPLDFGGIDLKSYHVTMLAPQGAVITAEVAATDPRTVFVASLNSTTP